MINAQEPFDPLLQFAAIERLVSKIYYRFSHLFLFHAVLRDFWWGMAREEEQHACILNACRAIIVNYEQETLDPMISADRRGSLMSVWRPSFIVERRRYTGSPPETLATSAKAFCSRVWLTEWDCCLRK